jgi:hypothetical protein
LIEKVGILKAGSLAATPASRAGMVAKGLGRRLGVEDQTVIEEVAHYTSSRWAKGATSQAYRKSTAAARDIIKEMEDAGVDGVLIGKLIEDPILRASASATDRDFAENDFYGKEINKLVNRNLLVVKIINYSFCSLKLIRTFFKRFFNSSNVFSFSLISILFSSILI